MPKAKAAVLDKTMLIQDGAAVVKAPKDYGMALNFRVPAHFLRAFKFACVDRGLNQTELLIELCSPGLEKYHKYD